MAIFFKQKKPIEKIEPSSSVSEQAPQEEAELIEVKPDLESLKVL